MLVLKPVVGEGRERFFAGLGEVVGGDDGAFREFFFLIGDEDGDGEGD